MTDNASKVNISATGIQLLVQLAIHKEWTPAPVLFEGLTTGRSSRSRSYVTLRSMVENGLVKVKSDGERRRLLYKLSENGARTIHLHPLISNAFMHSVGLGLDAALYSAEQRSSGIDEELVSNQAFLQSIYNLQNSLRDAHAAAASNNYLRVSNEPLQVEVMEYLKALEAELDDVIELTDMSAHPTPVRQSPRVRQWFEDEWPEAVKKLDSFISKEALADMLVPSGIVAAFGLCGVVAGFVLGAPPAVSFGAGTFIGMFATRQVTSKQVGERVDRELNEKKDVDEN